VNSSNDMALQSFRPDPSKYRKSVQLRLSIIVGIVLFVSIGITGAVLTNQHTEEITSTFITSLRIQGSTAADLSTRLILGAEVPDGALLTDICQNLKADNKSIFWVGISDTTGRFIAHTDISKVVTESKAPVLFNNSLEDSPRDLTSVYKVSSDTLFVKAVIEKDGLEVGDVTIAASTGLIRQALLESIRTIGSTSLIIMLLGLALQIIITRQQLRPIRIITDSICNHTDVEAKLQIPINSYDEFGYLAASLEAMDVQLGAARRTRMENERVAKELEFARELQGSILPESWPNTSRFAFAGAYNSAKQTGGDYYDFIQIDSNRLAFLVADVAGKSLPGMLVMLMTREVIRKAGRRLGNPRELLIYVNDELRKNIRSGTFVTMFYGILDTTNSSLTFSSAGHNALIHIRRESTEPSLLNKSGLPLGVYPNQTFEQHLQENTCHLNEGDLLIQFTDGINEARNIEDTEYGMDRFLRTLWRFREESAHSLVEKVIADHQRFIGEAEQYDDITLVVMKWGASGQAVMGKDEENAYVKTGSQ